MVVSFGTLFNNIYIERTDSTGTKLQKIKVPLSYSSKERMFYRLNIGAETPQAFDTQIVLPRLGFNITGITYDSERKRTLIQKRYAEKNNTMKYHYSEVPYNIQFSLYAYVRNVDDGLQILEQILPYFNPQFNITIKPNVLGDVNEKVDVPIVLSEVTQNETYEGVVKDDPHRIIIWELVFNAKTMLYGPINSTGLIKEADINIFKLEE
jgi:hypothetical protein